jgi:hypothetical protein
MMNAHKILDEELQRLATAKTNLRALVEIADRMPTGEDRDELFVKISAIIDALETEAKNLRDWGNQFNGVPKIH